MSVLSGLLGLGRRFGAQTQTSTIIVRRPGAPTRNENTGALVPTLTTIYTGPAELKFPDAQPHDVDAGGQRLAEQQPLVKLPITGPKASTAAAIRKDDVGEVLANPDDPTIIGTTFRVTGIHAQSNATARRLPVEVLSHA